MQQDIIKQIVDNNFNLEFITDLKDEIYLNIYTKDYDLCIDAEIAKCIYNYQDTIYKVYCLGKYGSTRVNRLLPEEKHKLTLKFKIKPGSTDYWAETRKILTMFMESLPAEHRIWALLLISLTFTGGLGLWLLYKYRIYKLPQPDLLNEQENTKKAIEKLSEIAEQGNTLAQKAIEYAMEKDKEIAESLNDATGEFVINGNKYTKREIENIVKSYSTKEEVPSASKTIKGRFIATNLSMEMPYKVKIKDEIGTQYNANINPEFLGEDVFEEIKRGIKSQIPIAFNMELSVVEENGKKETTLIRISKPQY